MRLLLIRHGQTPANVEGVLDAAVPGPGLTALGEQQAAALPSALAEERIRRICVSNMTRTSLTAAPLLAATGLTPEPLPGLREIGAGSLQGRADAAAVQQYIQTIFAWSHGDLDPRMPGGDDGHAFIERYDDAIARIALDAGDDAPGSASVAFSHAAAIRTWSALRAGNVDTTRGRFTVLDNTGVVALEGDPSTGWTVLSWNGQPVGGASLADPSAADPTGEAG